MPTSADVRARIIRERQAGGTYTGIAAGLDRDGIPTKNGGPWKPASVQFILHTSLNVEPPELAEALGLQHRRRPGVRAGTGCHPRSLQVQRYTRWRPEHRGPEPILMVRCASCGAVATIPDPGGS